MVSAFHIPAQYLTTVAKSFLDEKEDDSHTNLGWENKSLLTHDLNKGNLKLSFNYSTYALAWTEGTNMLEIFHLDAKTHSEIVGWIKQTSKMLNSDKEYEYKLHFELPYPTVSDNYTYTKPALEVINQHITRREMVNNVLQKVLEHHNADVRIWPHHFDTGSFIQANKNLGIGLGMAVPDDLIDDFYLYVSGYQNNEPISLSDDVGLANAKVYNSSWKGIALPVNGITEGEMLAFYNKAINLYKTT